jgi:hypothetical protein
MCANVTLARDQAPRPPPPALPEAPVSNIVAVPKELNVTPRSLQQLRAASWHTPADDVAALVAAKLSEAAGAAAAAAMQPIASAAETLSGSLSFVGASLPFQAGGAAAAAGVLVPASGAAPVKACPSEWFVCDDEEQHVRYFVIQGSDSLDHWITNLTFDPVPFEEAGLGVKVGGRSRPRGAPAGRPAAAAPSAPPPPPGRTGPGPCWQPGVCAGPGGKGGKGAAA